MKAFRRMEAASCRVMAFSGWKVPSSITLQNVILDTEVNGRLAPVILGHIREHGSSIGVALITQSVGNHASELGTSRGLLGLEGTIAHTGRGRNIAVLGSVHDVVIEPVTGVHVGRRTGPLPQ